MTRYRKYMALQIPLFQRIKPFLKVSSEIINKININASSINDLQQHPYLRQDLAKAIAAYRLQHGDFKSIEDLKRIDIITPELFNKISPYVSVE